MSTSSGSHFGSNAAAHTAAAWHQAMRIHDNWLDHPHRWMDRQCWLTHDLLEHNCGHNPRMGVDALLRTGRIDVEVHTVRSYVYDFRQGAFVPRDEGSL